MILKANYLNAYNNIQLIQDLQTNLIKIDYMLKNKHKKLIFKNIKAAYLQYAEIEKRLIKEIKRGIKI
jgi:hypothetical protein